MNHNGISEELKEYEKPEPRHGKDRNRRAAKIKQLMLATQRCRRRNKLARISRRKNRRVA
jgi:hypothetical protein